MLFWLICIILTLGVAALLATPLMRPSAAQTEQPDIAIYRDQLAEIDRDLARDVLDSDEAERARTEVARRILAANKVSPQNVTASAPSKLTTAAVALAILAVSFITYMQLGAPGYSDLPLKSRIAASDAARENRPDQATLEATAPPPPPVSAPQDYRDSIAQLRTIVPTRPDDLQGWELLAFHEAELRNYAAAAVAQQKVIGLKSDAATVDDQSLLLDLMVTAAGGRVSPESERLLREILDVDVENIAARYHLGALYNQTDRPDIAYRLWRGIVESGDANNFHVASARAQIEDAAFRAGVEYTLPPARGPNAEDIANATEMSEEERQSMIGNMVAGLAERLANEGGPASEWARLITAYSVLGDTESAGKVWVEARDVFGANEAAMETLTAAARQAGLVE